MYDKTKKKLLCVSMFFHISIERTYLYNLPSETFIRLLEYGEQKYQVYNLTLLKCIDMLSFLL